MYRYLFFFAIKRNILIQMVPLSANCQEENANRYIFSYALKESYRMHGFSKHALSVDARISSLARVVIDLDTDQEKILPLLFSFFPPRHRQKSLCSLMRLVCQFIEREANSDVTG